MVNKTFDKTFSYAPLYKSLERLGLTVKDLRKKVHISETDISKLTEGRPVTISTLCKTALLLGLELSDVVELNHDWEYDESKEFRKTLLC